MSRSGTLGSPLIESLTATRLRGFNVKSFQKTCVDFHWHFHPEIELTYIEEGQGILYAGRSITSFSKGDLFLLGANVPHAYGSRPEERTGAKWTVFHFLPELFGQDFWKLPDNRRLRQLLSGSQKGICFNGKKNLHCLALLSRIEENISRTVPLAACIELLGHLANIRDYDFLNASKWTLETGRQIDPRVQKILLWIDQHAGDSDLTQNNAARQIGMSPQEFCRFFRLHIGRSFRRYINELRVARTCSELLNSRKSISEIAFDAGFNNLANFNRRFRELIGYTPRTYRSASGGIVIR